MSARAAGTFLTLDTCTSRLASEGVADVRGAVEHIRSQRAHSIQMPDQYVFCHLALLEYAVSTTHTHYIYYRNINPDPTNSNMYIVCI